MTPDLSYTTGREGESSARIINGMGKTDTIQKQLSHKPHQQAITAGYRGGIPIQVYYMTSRSRRSLLLHVVGNMWLLVCRDMAI